MRIGSPPDSGQQAAQGEPALLRKLPLRDGHETAQPRLGSQQVIVAVVSSRGVHVVADCQELARLVEQESRTPRCEFAALLSKVPNLRRFARWRFRSGPRARAAWGSRCHPDGAANRFHSERSDIAVDSVRATTPRSASSAHVRTAVSPSERSRASAAGRERRFHALPTSTGMSLAREVRHHAERIFDSFKRARPENLVVGQREQSRAQGQQIAGEISAVHRRDVMRRQRLQGWVSYQL